MARSSILICTLVALAFALLSARHAESLTCDEVSKDLSPCDDYMKGAASPTDACCNGVKVFFAAASTTPDRRAACYCLKSLVAHIPNFDYGHAVALPSKCGINLPSPIPINPSINCSSIP